MKVWKTKSGEKITAKEFKNRFKKGLENITPIQKLSNELFSTFIMLVGYIVSTIALIIFRERLIVSWFGYGLILIFLGLTYSTVVKYLTTRQQLKLFKNLDYSSVDVDRILDNLERKVEGGK